MSNSEIRTTLLHLRDSDDHDDQKLIQYADFRILRRNLADGLSTKLRVLHENIADKFLQCMIKNCPPRNDSVLYSFPLISYISFLINQTIVNQDLRQAPWNKSWNISTSTQVPKYKDGVTNLILFYNKVIAAIWLFYDICISYIHIHAYTYILHI